MPIDWTLPLVARDGRPAELMPVDGWQTATGDTRRRVRTFNDRRIRFGTGEAKTEPYTVWLANEEGRVNCSGNDSPMDFFNDTAAVAQAA